MNKNIIMKNISKRVTSLERYTLSLNMNAMRTLLDEPMPDGSETPCEKELSRITDYYWNEVESMKKEAKKKGLSDADFEEVYQNGVTHCIG